MDDGCVGQFRCHRCLKKYDNLRDNGSSFDAAADLNIALANLDRARGGR